MSQEERELRAKLDKERESLSNLRSEILELDDEQRMLEIESKIKRSEIRMNALTGQLIELANKEQEELNNARGLNGQQFNPNSDLPVLMTREDVYDTDEYRSIFFKDLFKIPMSDDEQRFMGTNLTPQPGEGTALSTVPTKTMAKIMEQIELMSPLFADADKIMETGFLKLPVEKLTTDLPEKRLQGAVIKNIDFELDHIDFANYILSVMTQLAVEAKMQSISQIENFLVRKLGARMATKQEMWMLNGTGNGEFEGILNSSLPLITVPISLESPDDLLDLFGIIDPQIDYGLKFYTHKTTYFTMQKLMKDDTNNLMLNRDITTAGKRSFWDYEWKYAQVFKQFSQIAVGEPFGILANMKEGYLIKVGQNIQIESSTHSSFSRNLIDYKANFFGDGKPINPNAIFILTKKAPNAPLGIGEASREYKQGKGKKLSEIQEKESK
jgi:HK97 family phage major capsid protein